MNNIASAIQSITVEIQHIENIQRYEENESMYEADQSEAKIADCKKVLVTLRSVRETLENLDLP